MLEFLIEKNLLEDLLSYLEASDFDRLIMINKIRDFLDKLDLLLKKKVLENLSKKYKQFFQ